MEVTAVTTTVRIGMDDHQAILAVNHRGLVQVRNVQPRYVLCLAGKGNSNEDQKGKKGYGILHSHR